MVTSGDWPRAGGDDWMALVQRTLRGRSLVELCSQTRDGIEVRPLYTEGPARPSALWRAADPRRAEQGWDIRQRHVVTTEDLADAASPPEARRGVRQPDAAFGAGAPGAPGGSGSAAESLPRRIEDDLAGGATSIELDLPGPVGVAELDCLLEGVDLAETPVAVAPHAEIGTAQALCELAGRRGSLLAPRGSLGLDPPGEWARSGRNADCAPAAAWAASYASASSAAAAAASDPVQGRRVDPGSRGPASGHAAAASDSVQGRRVDPGSRGPASGPRAADAGLAPGVRVFCVDATRYADAGATEAQALGWMTAAGVACLRALVAAGLSADDAAALIGFRMAATADQFVTIAALRAARVMWHRVVTASGGGEESARQYQHAVTAAHTYSRRDPWVNLLRGAAAALAAGLAGADAVTVLALDHAAGASAAPGVDRAQARRLARNTQLLLVGESHAARAADPAGGSFYVESLTEELAREGWRILQQAQAAGGIDAVTADGSLAAAIEERWQARLDTLRTRREPLTAVSEYPTLDDAAPAPSSTTSGSESGHDDREHPTLDDAAPAPSPAAATPKPEVTADPPARSPGPDEAVSPGPPHGDRRAERQSRSREPAEAVSPRRGLPLRRLAEPFEDLRDAADRHRIATGARPAVWLSALGPAAAHSTRTAWAQNLLAVGGIEARGDQGVDSPVAAAAAFSASGLEVAVITGADDIYALRASATARALSRAGAALVALVCDPDTPAERLDELTAAGVSEFLHPGIDVIDVLGLLQRALGVS